MPAASPPPVEPFRYEYSDGFPQLLQQLGLSLAVTTYQAGKLMVIRSDGQKLSMLLRSFERPMGLAFDPAAGRLHLLTKRILWQFHNESAIAPQLQPAGCHDACFVPRRAHVTGDIAGHEAVFCGGKLWFVNTLFSCLCTADDERYSFVPRWRPRFVDRLAGEDRCHLNGVAVESDRIRYVTALGETNDSTDWRQEKLNGGIIIDVPGEQVVSRGLCMPHSPRVHRGDLYVLDSGHGALVRVNRNNGDRTTVAELPGFARGLALHNRYAFVGLSKLREKDVFDGMPIAARYTEEERHCGVSVVDLETGQPLEFLRFLSGGSEVFDVQALPGLRWPSVIGFQGEQVDTILLAPPDVWQPGAELPGI